MKIAIIAANGRVGKILVDQALAAGHTVRAGMRTESIFPTNPNLEVVHCDATQQTDLKNLIAGQDVVVSCIGHVKGSEHDMQTIATERIIATMHELGMTRLVTVTGAGVRFPGDKIYLIDRFLNFAVATVDPFRVADGANHVAVLQKSDLDWTVIRVMKLQNTKPHPYELTLNGPTKIIVSRYEVATAILQVLAENSFIKQAPLISHFHKHRS